MLIDEEEYKSVGLRPRYIVILKSCCVLVLKIFFALNYNLAFFDKSVVGHLEKHASRLCFITYETIFLYYERLILF